MVRSIVKKVMWVGRVTAFLVGLAVILAVVLGVATMAFAANGDAWRLGRGNVATAITSLGGAVGVNGPMLRLTNNNSGTDDTALDLKVQSGEPPMTVNSQTRVANLNAELAGQAGSANTAASADFASNAADSDKLDGKDSSELPGTVVQTKAITGNTSAVPFGTNTFVTNTVTVTTTSSTQQLVGVVSVPLKVDTGTPLEFTYGLCYRQADTTNTPNLFYSGTNETTGTATTTPTSWTAAQTKVVGLAGTWEVGFCARNSSNINQTLSGAGKANGWIEVMNPAP